MSDAVILAIVGGIIGLSTMYLKSRIDAKALLAAAIAEEKALKLENKVDVVKEKVEIVEKKLDDNHKQQNGNLTKLLETTTQLATAKEKAKHTDK